MEKNGIIWMIFLGWVSILTACIKPGSFYKNEWDVHTVLYTGETGFYGQQFASEYGNAKVSLYAYGLVDNDRNIQYTRSFCIDYTLLNYYIIFLLDYNDEIAYVYFQDKKADKQTDRLIEFMFHNDKTYILRAYHYDFEKHKGQIAFEKQLSKTNNDSLLKHYSIIAYEEESEDEFPKVDIMRFNKLLSSGFDITQYRASDSFSKQLIHITTKPSYLLIKQLLPLLNNGDFFNQASGISSLDREKFINMCKALTDAETLIHQSAFQIRFNDFSLYETGEDEEVQQGRGEEGNPYAETDCIFCLPDIIKGEGEGGQKFDWHWKVVYMDNNDLSIKGKQCIYLSRKVDAEVFGAVKEYLWEHDSWIGTEQKFICRNE